SPNPLADRGIFVADLLQIGFARRARLHLPRNLKNGLFVRTHGGHPSTHISRAGLRMTVRKTEVISPIATAVFFNKSRPRGVGPWPASIPGEAMTWRKPNRRRQLIRRSRGRRQPGEWSCRRRTGA